MRRQCFTVLLANVLLGIMSNAIAQQKTIHGVDDRLETYQVNAATQRAADAVVAFFHRRALRYQPDTQRYLLVDKNRLIDQRWCHQERFAQQPAVAFCTGVLIGDRLVATAAHCVTDNGVENSSLLEEYAVVFGYQMSHANQAPQQFPENNVYFTEGIDQLYSDPERRHDAAVVRLHRPVVDHQPIQLALRVQMPINTPLTLIGYPLGLPQKVAAGGLIVEREAAGAYVTNVDAFHGNSGSPVFVTDSLTTDYPVVVGLLSEGSRDYTIKTTAAGQCRASHHCQSIDPDSLSCKGEILTPIDQVSSYVNKKREP